MRHPEGYWSIYVATPWSRREILFILRFWRNNHVDQQSPERTGHCVFALALGSPGAFFAGRVSSKWLSFCYYSCNAYDVLSTKWPNYGFRVVALGGAEEKAK